jgi:Fe-S cluster biogenesis protein NfuA
MDTEAITAAVDETGRFLRADGADLRVVDVDPKAARVRLQLVFDGVECADCVLPPDALHETIVDALQRRVPGEYEVLVDDPRR